ncbi:class I ribonucleotide reductase maintenance protein YfaE [Buchnera aphidicola]|uniref:class I ribonucleotide reductase maintenance protein YfaE n=1 Tax=Buchnera aphidicola TaxID=9 RepID=UPI0034649BDB
MNKKIITIHNKNIQIQCKKKKLSLLKILIKNNIYICYQCQEGYCGTCRIILLKGRVFYKKNPLASLQKNEILTCCCKISNDITIKLYT